MKLTSAQIERTLSQFEAQAIPESHPVLTRLNELFGDHTFFVDSDGLSIVEPIDGPAPRRTQAARVVNVANWSDESLANLAAHEPEPTDAIVELGYKHRSGSPFTLRPDDFGDVYADPKRVMAAVKRGSKR
jgi:hypothetical protein